MATVWPFWCPFTHVWGLPPMPDALFNYGLYAHTRSLCIRRSLIKTIFPPPPLSEHKQSSGWVQKSAGTNAGSMRRRISGGIDSRSDIGILVFELSWFVKKIAKKNLKKKKKLFCFWLTLMYLG